MEDKVEKVRSSYKLESIRENARQELVDSGALMTNAHFETNNDHHCTDYINRHAFTFEPERGIRLVRLLWELLFRSMTWAQLREVEFVAGPATGGALIANHLAGILQTVWSESKPVRYVEISKDPKAESGLSLQPFYVERIKGKKGLLVDDVLDWGFTAERSRLELLHIAQAQVIGMGFIADRGNCRLPWAPNVHSLYATNRSNYFPSDDCPMCKQGIPITHF